MHILQVDFLTILFSLVCRQIVWGPTGGWTEHAAGNTMYVSGTGRDVGR